MYAKSVKGHEVKRISIGPLLFVDVGPASRVYVYHNELTRMMPVCKVFRELGLFQILARV